MVTVERHAQFDDYRNPLRPEVSPTAFSEVLRTLGIPDREIPKRKVLISPHVLQNKGLYVHGDFNTKSKVTRLFPGLAYPPYIERLAIINRFIDDVDRARMAAEATTEVLHDGLASVLLHEAKHDGDYNRGIDFGDGPVRHGLSTVFSAVGCLSGLFISSFLTEGTQMENYAIALALGVAAGVAVGINDKLIYAVDPIEVRARMFEKVEILGVKEKLITTTLNPNVDLNYGHTFPQDNGSRLSISNRQILDLRFGY